MSEDRQMVFLVGNGMDYDDNTIWIITVPDAYADLKVEIALVLPWLVSGEDPKLIGVGENWNPSPDYDSTSYGNETFEGFIKGYWFSKHPLTRNVWDPETQKHQEVNAPQAVNDAGNKILQRIPEEWLT